MKVNLAISIDANLEKDGTTKSVKLSRASIEEVLTEAELKTKIRAKAIDVANNVAQALDGDY